MEFETIRLINEEGFSILQFSRQREMNALSKKMREEIVAGLDLLEKDTAVRSVIITGGDYIFSAGMDLKEMVLLEEEDVESYFESMLKCLQKIYVFKKPVIAAVGGIALGGGFNIAAVCDMIIASENAIFGHPELKFGLNPLLDPLRRAVGLVKAKEIAMLGEPLGAKEALKIGLVNKLALPENFMEEAKTVARELSKRSAKAIEAVKKISNVSLSFDKTSALEHEFHILTLLFSRQERKDHMKKFIENMKNRKKK